MENDLGKSEITNNDILEKVIEKIKQVNNTVSVEWKIGKNNYILKNGTYGYYIEEWNNNKKKNNYSLKFLMNKIAKNNKLDINNKDDVVKITQLIEHKDIQEAINYVNNKK